METVEYKNISFTVWDVGGQDKVRHSAVDGGGFGEDWGIVTSDLGADPSPLAPLLPEHPGHHLRGGLQRP